MNTSNERIIPGGWYSWRNDPGNTGEQPLSGNISTPVDTAQLFLSGSVDSFPLLFPNTDGSTTIYACDSGKVIALLSGGQKQWESSNILATHVYDSVDLDADGKNELVVFCDKSLYILAADDGSVLFNLQLDENLNQSSFKLDDFNQDGKIEAAFYVFKRPYIYIYRFYRDETDVFQGELAGQIVDERSENNGNISAFTPGLAIENLDADAQPELAVIRYEGMDVYDGNTMVPPATHKVKASPIGVTAESEYPGGGFPASNLIDGNPTTYFISEPQDALTANCWMEFSLPAGSVVGTVTVTELYAPVVQVQVLENEVWVTKASANTSGGPSPYSINLPQPVTTDAFRLNVEGSNFGTEGARQVQLTEVEYSEGTLIPAVPPQTHIDWLPPGASSGRNYGCFTLRDIDGDGLPEAIMMADGVSMHADVLKNTAGEFSVLWTQYYGYAGQPSTDGLYYTMRVVNDPVVNLNNDEQVFMVYGIFTAATAGGSGDWTIHIRNCLAPDTNPILLPGYYLYGISYGDNDIMRRQQCAADVDGDGIKEIAIQYTTDDETGEDNYRGQFYYYNGLNGNAKYTYDLKPAFGGSGVTARDIIACDINGDTKEEFIISTNTGWVVALSEESALAKLVWSLNLNYSACAPIAADIKNDGFSEIVVPAQDGKLHIITG